MLTRTAPPAHPADRPHTLDVAAFAGGAEVARVEVVVEGERTPVPGLDDLPVRRARRAERRRPHLGRGLARRPDGGGPGGRAARGAGRAGPRRALGGAARLGAPGRGRPARRARRVRLGLGPGVQLVGAHPGGAAHDERGRAALPPTCRAGAGAGRASRRPPTGSSRRSGRGPARRGRARRRRGPGVGAHGLGHGAAAALGGGRRHPRRPRGRRRLPVARCCGGSPPSASSATPRSTEAEAADHSLAGALAALGVRAVRPTVEAKEWAWAQLRDNEHLSNHGALAVAGGFWAAPDLELVRPWVDRVGDLVVGMSRRMADDALSRVVTAIHPTRVVEDATAAHQRPCWPATTSPRGPAGRSSTPTTSCTRPSRAAGGSGERRAGPGRRRSSAAAAPSRRPGPAPALRRGRRRPRARGGPAARGDGGRGARPRAGGPPLRRPRGARGALEGGSRRRSADSGRAWRSSASASRTPRGATPSEPRAWSTGVRLGSRSTTPVGARPTGSTSPRRSPAPAGTSADGPPGLPYSPPTLRAVSGGRPRRRAVAGASRYFQGTHAGDGRSIP